MCARRPAAMFVPERLPSAPFANSTVASKASSVSTGRRRPVVGSGRSAMNVATAPPTADGSPTR